jgi:hypothetical protein
MANWLVRVSGLAAVAAAVTAASISGQRGAVGIGARGTGATTNEPYVATVSHLAGPATGPGYADGPGSAARFAFPWGVAVDSTGVAFVADSANNTIRKVAVDGTVTTVAGKSGSAGTADGAGADARFSFPTCVVVAAGGALYVCDSGNNTIRAIDASGVVSTLAGSPGHAGFQDGTGAGALFNRPLRAAIDNAGNLVVADSGNQVMRRVTAAGVVTTLAGTPGQAGSGDGPAAQAQFNGPSGLVVGKGSAGIVFWVADSGNDTIRYVNDQSVVSTVAGTAGTAGSSDGAWTAARFDQPSDIARAFDLGFVLTDTANHTVRWLKGPGTTATLAGTAGAPGFADGAGTAARFNAPRGITMGAGSYLVADTSNHAIRTVSSAGTAATLAGTAAVAGSADGSGGDARFASPSGVAFDPVGNVFVADTGNHTVRTVDATGMVLTLAGTAGQPGSADGSQGAARFNSPYGIAVDAHGTAFVTDQGNHTVRTVTAAGLVGTLAGSAGSPGSADGAGADARFDHPAGIALGSDGTVYVADRDNDTIRAITAGGVVTTLAGSPGVPGNDDGSGTAARFDQPTGLAVDTVTGELLVADRGNHRIRRVTPQGAVTTLTAQGSGGATPLVFTDPVGVAVDALGNVFVVDGSSHDIVLLRTTGELLAFAGAPGTPGNVDGVASDARLFLPLEIAAGPLGVLVVADSGSNAIRTLTYEVAIEECVPASVAAQTPSQVVAAGQSFTVSLTAGGTPPFTYQWYLGQRGDTSTPIAGATSRSYVLTAAQTTALWARVTNACGSADTDTITLTVCTYALAPPSAGFTYAGGDGSVTVTTPSPCPWTAVASAGWITFPDGASGTGPATLAYAVAPNDGEARSATITVGDQVHTVTQSLFPRYFVPSVAHLPGVGGTKWRTDLAVVNRNGAAADLTLTFWPYGNGGDGVVATHTLAAGAAVEWSDVLVSLFHLASTNVKGSVQVDGSAPVVVSSRTYNQAAAGTYGQEYPAIRAGTALPLGAIGVLPQLARNAGFRTNLGLLNAGVGDATVEIRLFAASGPQVGTTRTATVAPGRYWQQDDIFGAAGAGDQSGAYATIGAATTGGAVWAYASVIDNATGDPTTVPVQVASASGPFLVSSQAHLPGLAGTQWRSSLSVVNRGDAEAALTLRFLPYGTGAAISRTEALAAGAAVEWSDVLVSLFGKDPAGSAKGSVEITSAQPVVIGARTFNQAETGTYGQGYPPIATGQGVASGQIGVIPQLRKDAAFRTNIGVLNVGAADATVAVILFGADGAQVGAVTTATVAPSRYWQQDDIFRAAGAGTQELAYATVEVQTPGGRVWAYGSVIDAVTGDPTTMSVLLP